MDLSRRHSWIATFWRKAYARRSRSLTALLATLTALLLVGHSALAGMRFACCAMTSTRSLHACCPAPAAERAPAGSEFAANGCCAIRTIDRLPSGQIVTAPQVGAPQLTGALFYEPPIALISVPHRAPPRPRACSDPPTAQETRLRLMVFLT